MRVYGEAHDNYLWLQRASGGGLSLVSRDAVNRRTVDRLDGEEVGSVLTGIVDPVN